jgi:hypothetical protein
LKKFTVPYLDSLTAKEIETYGEAGYEVGSFGT